VFELLIEFRNLFDPVPPNKRDIIITNPTMNNSWQMIQGQAYTMVTKVLRNGKISIKALMKQL